MNNKKKCDNCGNYYDLRKGNKRFCSLECYNISNSRLILTCIVCSEPFAARNNTTEKPRRACSPKCAGILRRKRKELSCPICNITFFSYPCYIKGREIMCCSKECRVKMLKIRYQGEKNPNWKGGVKPLQKIIRDSEEFQQWRNSVYERDFYTCQCCGQLGYTLNAHHIKSFAHYEDLRFDVNNGITLCKMCHKEVHAWRIKPIKTDKEVNNLKEKLQRALMELGSGYSAKPMYLLMTENMQLNVNQENHLLQVRGCNRV